MLDQVIRRAAESFGTHPAYETADGWTVSYTDLDRRSDELAVGLARRGIGLGSVVALVLPSTVDYVVAYLACAKLGAVAAGINPHFGAHERSSVLATTAPDLVLAEPEMAEGLTGTDAEILALRTAEHVDAIAADLRARDEAPPALPPDDARPVCIVFTSGSTGEPKGALFRSHQLRAIAELDTGGAWGGGGHSTAPTAFAHSGFMTKLQWLLAGGGTTHLQHRWRAARTLELIHTHRMPAVTGVAPQIALMLRVPDFDRYDFSCVQAVVAGAANSPPALVREARERFDAPYSIRYSSTESGGIGLGTALDADDEEAFHTIGRPRPGVRAEVREPDGSPVVDGEIGELWIASPCIMSEYWRNPDATAEVLVDGWLRTGDLALVDDRGLFRLAGRAKEMFIRGGYNVYPMEVEHTLGTHPAVVDLAIVPRPDPVMGEIGVAVVIPADPDHPPTLDDLRDHGADRLARFKLPEAIRYVDDLPLNVNGKLDRRALAAEEAAGAPDR